MSFVMLSCVCLQIETCLLFDIYVNANMWNSVDKCSQGHGECCTVEPIPPTDNHIHLSPWESSTLYGRPEVTLLHLDTSIYCGGFP